jgi:hypothetical protein
MALVKIEEALNTWIVDSSIDERMRKFNCLSKIRQDMILAIVDRAYEDELIEQSENVVPLKAVNE